MESVRTLKPEYLIEPNIITRNTSGGSPPGTNKNKAPVLRVEGPEVTRTL